MSEMNLAKITGSCKTLASGISVEDQFEMGLRNGKKGASEAGVIMGVNRFKSVVEMWYEDTGRKERELLDSEQIFFGNGLEPALRELFMDYGNKYHGLQISAVFEQPQLYQSVYYPEMITNLDGLVEDEEGLAILEIKNTTTQSESYWREDGEEGVPDEYYWQAIHQMIVTGLRKVYFFAGMGSRGIIRKVRFSEAMASEYLARLKKYFLCVATDEMPAVGANDVDALNRVYGDHQGEIDMPENENLINTYLQIGKQIKQLESDRDEIEAILRKDLGSNAVVSAGERMFSVKGYSRKDFDKKKFAADHPELYAKYIKTSVVNKKQVK